MRTPPLLLGCPIHSPYLLAVGREQMRNRNRNRVLFLFPHRLHRIDLPPSPSGRSQNPLIMYAKPSTSEIGPDCGGPEEKKKPSTPLSNAKERGNVGMNALRNKYTASISHRIERRSGRTGVCTATHTHTHTYSPLDHRAGSQEALISGSEALSVQTQMGETKTTKKTLVPGKKTE